MAAPFGDTAVPAKYQPTVLAAALKYGVSPAFLAAQLNAESGFNPNAVSPDGAIGIAQFMPGTAQSLGLNPRNATDSIYAMAKLMAHYKKQFGTWEKALYAYHDGPGAVESPGPAGRKYAKEILGISGGGGSSSGTGTDPQSSSVASLLDPFKNTERLISKLGDSGTWKRAGLYLGGFLLVVAGIMFLFRKQVGPVAEQIIGVAKKEKSNGKSVVEGSPSN